MNNILEKYALIRLNYNRNGTPATYYLEYSDDIEVLRKTANIKADYFYKTRVDSGCKWRIEKHDSNNNFSYILYDSYGNLRYKYTLLRMV